MEENARESDDSSEVARAEVGVVGVRLVCNVEQGKEEKTDVAD